MEIKVFQTFKIKTTKDLEVSDEFIPENSQDLISSGIIEESERGNYEIMTLKSGSNAYAFVGIGGEFSLTDSDGSHTSHGVLERADFTILEDIVLPKILKPVPGRPGLWS